MRKLQNEQWEACQDFSTLEFHKSEWNAKDSTKYISPIIIEGIIMQSISIAQ
jgi:hypothetical protein